ncbi:ATP-dependent protease ATPase subunit HslU [Spirochaeta cellobiosiphila]|uniref:ATP-dependent protease ATPase subunit HslU n=1 Tax=Spirochaeta cellobiosiphila TaxID=504483 RepID=UPI000412C0E8|nr:ATP-dependent protease ATPase subunit HslU [Spirochaeta cellobiosiphila]
MAHNVEDMSPKEIVEALDKYIIGQNRAKKSVALAVRNRIRRQKLSEELQEEIAPKNIIMIGPTGVGKTEIARRLSKLTGAPFIKVEATKYTEVGYVGRDVESMVRDLMHSAVATVKDELRYGIEAKAEEKTEEILLDLLLPGSKKDESTVEGSDTRDKFRQMLKDGKFDEKQVEINVSSKGNMPSIEIFSGTSFEEMDMNLGSLGNIFGNKKKKKNVSVSQARKIILQEEIEKLIDYDRASEIAKDRVENLGIIFIDEIDKIATKQGNSSGDVSREGVQRDILPIVEGSKVNTKFGIIDTSHILFIAAGAFHISKPSDLIPELQGRFPIRVELEELGAEDFEKILTQPRNALIKQYQELLKTEGVTLDFTVDGIKRISEIAVQVNTQTENIGARRLHTVLEKVLEDVSFCAPDLIGQVIPITPEYINERIGDIVKNEDLSRYIL